MKYPIFQISDNQWTKLHEFDVEYSDKLTITSVKKLEKYFLFSEYIDSNGDIYKVTDFQTTGILSRMLRYIPLIPFTGKLIFTKVNRSLNLEQFRALVLKRANSVVDYKEFATIVTNAKSHKEIMGDQG